MAKVQNKFRNRATTITESFTIFTGVTVYRLSFRISATSSLLKFR